MKIEVSEELKDKFLEFYKEDFDTCLRSTGEINAFYRGRCSAMESLLTELGIVDKSEFRQIQADVQENIEDEKQIRSQGIL